MMEYRFSNLAETEGASYVNNLSREGMSFEAQRRLDEGAFLNMKILLPVDDKPIYVTGEVAWTSEAEKKDCGYTVGIRFFKIDNYDKARLLDYVYTEWLKASKSC